MHRTMLKSSNTFFYVIKIYKIKCALYLVICFITGHIAWRSKLDFVNVNWSFQFYLNIFDCVPCLELALCGDAFIYLTLFDVQSVTAILPAVQLHILEILINFLLTFYFFLFGLFVVFLLFWYFIFWTGLFSFSGDKKGLLINCAFFLFWNGIMLWNVYFSDLLELIHNGALNCSIFIFFVRGNTALNCGVIFIFVKVQLWIVLLPFFFVRVNIIIFLGF